jgi:serine/threonine protein kinase/WD40 repeat protein
LGARNDESKRDPCRSVEDALMSPNLLPDLVGWLREQGLLQPAQWEELAPLLAGETPDGQRLLDDLVRRGWLTAYQAERLGQGRGAGLVFGPYRVLEPLGRGGMGQVFKALHPLMNRVVALKVIGPERLGETQTLQRFRREIEAAARLTHPNVVIAHDAAPWEGAFYFVMEYVEGIDLAGLMRGRGPLPAALACDYMRQAALGLHHAHENGLVHRDVKPSNILLAAQGGVIKILDLGLARLHESAVPAGVITDEGTVMGTPDYLAPEQASDPSAVDARADIYSLGCTLFELVTGKPPFDGGTWTQKLARHLTAPPPDVRAARPELPADLSLLVRRMLAKRPDERPQTAAAVANELAAFAAAASTAGSATVDHLPVVAPETVDMVRAAQSEPTTLLAPRRRRRWLAAAVGAAALVLLGGVVLLAALGRLSWLMGPDGGDAKDAALDDRNRNRPGGGGNGGVPPPEPDVAAGPLESVQHAFLIRSVAFSADGKYGLVADPDGNLYAWDVAQDRELGPWKPARTPKTPNLPPPATDVDLGKAMELLKGFDLGDAFGKQPFGGMLSGKGVGGSVLLAPQVAALPGKHAVVVGDLKGVVRVWSVPDGGELAAVQAHVGPVANVGCTGDGRFVLTFGAADGAARVWRADTWKLHRQFACEQLLGAVAALAPDGTRLLLTGPNNVLNVWHVESEKVVGTLKGHKNLLLCAAISPDGKYAVTGSADGTARLWDLASGAELRRFLDHEKTVTGVAFAPDGERVLTADSAGTVRLFQTHGGLLLREEKGHADGMVCVAYSPGGRRALTAGLDSRLRLWGLPK